MASLTRSTRIAVFAGVFALAAGLRLGFGLASAFWTEDERQVYLIGLEVFTERAWPYFGPDVVWTGTRLPGALLGLLVGLPFFLLRAPEAPFVLLNLLSTAALIGFGWYLHRRVPGVPRWLIYGWVLTCPWTLHFSTHVVNPSYVLPGAVIFFIGFLEAMPSLSAGVVPRALAWAFMGFGVTWTLQLHLSWVLLPPFIAVAIAARGWRPQGSAARALAALAAGALIPASLLVPTWMAAGLDAGGADRNVVIHPQSAGAFVTILAQFLSFASFEINRFIGLDTAERLLLLGRHWWLVPPALILLLLGIVQPVALLVTGFRGAGPSPDWPAVRRLAALSAVWIWAAYWFSVQRPQAHAFYVMLPVATVYAMHAWAFYTPASWFRRAAAASLILNVLFHAGFALARGPERSLYRARWLVQQAIDTRTAALLGDRRPAGAGRPATERRPAFHAADPLADLRVTEARWTTAAGGRISLFDVTIHHAGTGAAYIDLQYDTRYRSADGRDVGRSAGALKYILQPGDTRRWPHLTDGFVPAGAAWATFTLVGAEKVVPAR